jgi:hypothetical protein
MTGILAIVAIERKILVLERELLVLVPDTMAREALDATEARLDGLEAMVANPGPTGGWLQ